MSLPKQEIAWWKGTLSYREYESIEVDIKRSTITKLKSVTAKVLANKFNLPVVVVKYFGDNNQQLIEFLSSFNFDCVFFFD